MIRFTEYAEDKLRRRNLPRDLVKQVATKPEQVAEEGARTVAQSRYTDTTTGKAYLLRVIYEQQGQDRLVITAYQTSKITKYWRPE